MTPENLLRAAGYWPAVIRAARIHGVAPVEILSKGQGASISAARHELWWILRDTFGLSWPRIAELTGTHHTSAVKGLQARRDALQAAYRAEAAE